MSAENHKSERIAKRIARAGICSRRDAERLIEDGRVKVNGKVLETPAFLVKEGDTIEVDGQLVGGQASARLFLYHKPAGLVTTHKDEKGRPTVFQKMPPALPRVVSVGRLDLNTEVLLLLTNDGALARYLELPSSGWSRKYRVRVRGDVTEKRLERLRKGITVEGVHYKPIEVVIDSQNKGSDSGEDEDNRKHGMNSWLSVTLREGKNREIRKVMEAIGLQVSRLIRVSYGPFNLGKMKRGDVMEIRPHILKAQIPWYFKE